MAELVALLDLGSNAARFVLARVKPRRGYKVLREERVQTRLGSGTPGHLPRAAISTTLGAVHAFLGRVRNGAGMTNGAGPRVLAVATEAVRLAENRDRLLAALREQEGVSVHVLSGRDEGRLGALAALRSLSVRDGAVADLGGGSLQLTRIRAGRIGLGASLPLGALRLTERYLRHDPPTTSEVRALRADVRHHLADSRWRAAPGDSLVGLGGTVRCLARLHLFLNRERRKSRHGLVLLQSDVTAIRERLEPLTIARRRRVPGLKAERADIVLGGILVLEELMLFGGYFTLTVCTRGVRDGLLLCEAWRERPSELS
jgi:exopolyphosphatase/guanosine-5'-triphosphate,3'-diphosphate pyrophosphatase